MIGKEGGSSRAACSYTCVFEGWFLVCSLFVFEIFFDDTLGLGVFATVLNSHTAAPNPACYGALPL